MNPDQNAYKEQVPPAPVIMSQLLLHSSSLLFSILLCYLRYLLFKFRRD